MEIRSLEVDIDKGILKINGQDVDTPTIVTLPGPEGWPLQRSGIKQYIHRHKKYNI